MDFIYNKGKDNEYHALINISLDIYPEEFIIVFGPSGCGKSTLLNVFAGLETPDTGNISVLGRDLIKMTKNEFAYYHRREVGMIYQAYNLITSLSVLDNVALPQMFVNVKKGKRDQWSRQLLERFGILKHAKKIPTELSGGQQQRIGIARAIVNNPKIVLADEPVGNLDSVSAKNVLNILSDLNEKEKKTVIMVTHNPEYLGFGDRIIYMKDGIITKEVVNHEKNRELKEKSEIAPKAPSAEISDLMRAYHGLSPEQINILIMPYKAKVFAHHFITTKSMEETKVFEEVVQRRLLGVISQDEFFDVLNRSYADGGVGFDRRTAERVMRRINRVIRMAYFVYQKQRQRKDEQGRHIPVTLEEKALKVSDYLLKTCYYEHYQNLNDVQISRLRKAVRDRLNTDMQKADFYRFLDKPFSKGGVGLNIKTAQAITEELELILILGFGIVKEDNDDDPDNELLNRENIEKDPDKFRNLSNISSKIAEIGIAEAGAGQPGGSAGHSAGKAMENEGDLAQKPEEEALEAEPEGSAEESREALPDKGHPPNARSLQDAILAAQEREEELKK